MKNLLSCTKLFLFSLAIFITTSYPQSNNVPVVVSGDTLFFVRTNIGPFTADQRVKELTGKINSIIQNGENPDSIKPSEFSGYTNILLNNRILMSVTNADAEYSGKRRADLTREIILTLQKQIRSKIEQYSSKRLQLNGGITLGLFLLLVGLLLLFRKIFPYGYKFLEKQEGKLFRGIHYRKQEIISAENISSFFIFLLKSIRLAITLTLFYFFIIYSFSLFPWTKEINIRPVLGGIFSSIALIIITYVVIRSIYVFLSAFSKKTETWKGSVIKSVKVKNLEVVSEDRILEQVKFGIKVFKFAINIVIAYFFVTLLFSFFSFSKT